jgi:hypothetical protein
VGHSGHRLTQAVDSLPLRSSWCRLKDHPNRRRHQQLHDRGVDVDELLRWDGVPPMFGFHDPDGIGLHIIQEVN